MKNKKIMILMFVLTLFMMNVGKVECVDVKLNWAEETTSRSVGNKFTSEDYYIFCPSSLKSEDEVGVGSVTYEYDGYEVTFTLTLGGLGVNGKCDKSDGNECVQSDIRDIIDGSELKYWNSKKGNPYDNSSLKDFSGNYGAVAWEKTGEVAIDTCFENGFVVVGANRPVFNIYGVKYLRTDVLIDVDKGYNDNTDWNVVLKDLDYGQRFHIAYPFGSNTVQPYFEPTEHLSMSYDEGWYKITSSPAGSPEYIDEKGNLQGVKPKYAEITFKPNKEFTLKFYRGNGIKDKKGQSLFEFGNSAQTCENELNLATTPQDKYELYEKWKYNGLLNFGNPVCEDLYVEKSDNPIASCDSKLKFAINQVLKARKITSTEENEVSFEDAFAMVDLDGNSIFEKIEKNGRKVYCKYDYETNDSKINNKEEVFSGQTLWPMVVNDPIFKLKITQTCATLNSYGFDNINAETKSKFLEKIGKINFLAKKDGGTYYFFLNKNNIDNTESLGKINGVWIKTTSKTYDVYYGVQNWLHYTNGFSGGINKIDASLGSFINEQLNNINTQLSNINNYINENMVVLGFSTKIDEEITNGNVKFEMTADSTTTDTTCKYSTKCQLVDCPDNPDDPDEPDDGTKKLNLEFRIIDTDEPFPGKDGLGRETGSNWCEPTADISVSDVRIKYLECKDLLGRSDVSLKEKRECYLAARNDLESIANGGLNCDKNNEMVKTYITNRNNSYNIKNEEPLISITLDSTLIKNIREYNQGKNYVDNSLTCTNGEECKSSFVTKLLNNEYGYGQESGSCVGEDNRTYCVGG